MAKIWIRITKDVTIGEDTHRPGALLKLEAGAAMKLVKAGEAGIHSTSMAERAIAELGEPRKRGPGRPRKAADVSA